MEVIKDRIGNTEVYIQTFDDQVVVVGEAGAAAGAGRATQPTSIEDDVRQGYLRVKSLIKELAEDFGTELLTVANDACPNSLEMELSLGLSAEGKVVWLVSGKGEFGMKVKLTWNLGDNDEPK